MLEKIYINKPDHTDLNMYRCGIEDCVSGHSWGPALRDHYIIHYITSGKGTYHIGSNTYKLEKGSGFLIPPNTVISYQADLEEPWSYCWVGFHGLKAENYLKRANLSADNPIFSFDRDDSLRTCINEMIDTKKLAKSSDIKLLGLLYVFLSLLVEASEANKHFENPEDRKEQYVKKAIDFIKMNYAQKITVQEIASSVGIDRSYLFSLFKEYLNTSPQDFLINFRIGKACELMENNALSIGDISRSIGYEDQLLFSKIFKKVKGTSPKTFRKEPV